MPQGITRSGDSRVWLIPYGAGPTAVPEYLGCGKVGDPAWPQGEPKSVECPSELAAGQFEVVDEIPGAPGRVTTSISGLYSRDLSRILELVRSGCGFDLHVLEGRCTSMKDYTAWDKMVIFPRSYWTNYSIARFGAMSKEELDSTQETGEVSAREMYEIAWQEFLAIGAATVVRELVSVDICDAVSCGVECGYRSTGCERVFAVMVGVGATPGTKPSVVYSHDSGTTVASTDIDTMFSNETVTDSECIGSYFVVVSPTSNSVHYAKSADIIAGTETWYEQTDGFVLAGAPRKIWSWDAAHTWIAGTAGYIYFMSSPATDVTVQDAGTATAQTFQDIHGYNGQHIVAVGNNNAVVHTTDGGKTWGAVTGPAAGVQLNAVLMWNQTTWLVGTSTGRLYYTDTSGVSWTELTLPGSITNIYDIQRSKDVLLLAGVAGANGKILKSTAGGAEGTWYVLPESGSAIPANDRINQVAICENDPNVAFAAGLADDGSDGTFLKIT